MGQSNVKQTHWQNKKLYLSESGKQNKIGKIKADTKQNKTKYQILVLFWSAYLKKLETKIGKKEQHIYTKPK